MAAQTVQAVIFDLDGVLVDSEPAHRAASRRLVAPHPLTDEEYARFIGSTLDAFMKWVRTRYAMETSIQQLSAQYDALVEAEVVSRRLPPLDGALELTDALRDRRLSLAVASQSLRSWVHATLAGAVLDGRFDVVVAADAVQRGKPAPDIYLHTAALLGVEPASCLVIEDSVPGIQAGLAAGMTLVQSRQGSVAMPPQPGVHHVIQSLREFDLAWLGNAR